MRIEDQFRVNVPVEDAWKLLLDIERIAPCMPGAQLQEIEGDEFRGIVKVKVGPITAQYKGTARFTEVDHERHRAVISATAPRFASTPTCRSPARWPSSGAE
jgi:carbon monoxide dehydrogenase subunit G